MRFGTLILLASVLAAYAPAADEPKVDLKKGIAFTGRAEANVVEIHPRVTGFLDRALVKEGNAVQKGDLLAEIDDRPYKLQFNGAKARLAAAQAKMKAVGVDFDRVKGLFARGAASKDDFLKTEAERDEAEARVEVGRAEVAMTELNLAFTKLTAPISGRVDRFTTSPGNLLIADGPALVSIVASDPIAVVFNVDERSLLAIRRATIDDAGKPLVEVGLSDEDGYPHKATLDAMGATVDPKTGTVRFRATLANPKDLIAHGMFVRVRLTMQSGK